MQIKVQALNDPEDQNISELPETARNSNIETQAADASANGKLAIIGTNLDSNDATEHVINVVAADGRIFESNLGRQANPPPLG